MFEMVQMLHSNPNNDHLTEETPNLSNSYPGVSTNHMFVSGCNNIEPQICHQTNCNKTAIFRKCNQMSYETVKETPCNNKVIFKPSVVTLGNCHM